MTNMKQIVHLSAAIVATLLIGTFFVSSVIVELLGSHDAIVTVKRLIVTPGLFLLVPAIAITGATGFALGAQRKGRLVETKKKRMPFVGANGILILLPAAIYLNHLASSGNFDFLFYVVQGIELLAGAINFTLMSLNIRDGLRLSGRFRVKK